MHALSLIDVRKDFKDKTAVCDVNLYFHHGIYGLLGENGAGKTTLMRMICGILQPTRGMVICDGIEIGKMGGAYRRILGYLPQDFGYYREFSAGRFLHYMAALKAMPEGEARRRIHELLEMVDLADVKHKKLKTFSGGMLRRIGIAQALLNEPEILILDEPTAGVDPKERVRFRNIISSLGKERIVILSTHIVSDIEYIADEIMMMQEGHMIQTGTCEALLESVRGCVWKCLVDEAKAEELNRKYIVSNLKRREHQVELRIVAPEKPVPEAVLQEAALEDVYLYAVQNSPAGREKRV